MGLFKKKVEKKEFVTGASSLPESPRLPELPELPELPAMNEDMSEEALPQLPSFPNSDFGNKFSRESIKEAVSGKKEGEEVPIADDFDEEQMMQGPLKKPLAVEEEDFDEDEEMEKIPRRSYEASSHFKQAYSATRKAEPIFIRIDKFEESLKIFEKAKDQVSEIEDLIKHTKALKAKEEEELNSWEKEIQSIKQEVEKIDKDIFSKIE